VTPPTRLARAVPEQMYGLHLSFPWWTGASQLQLPYIRVKTAITSLRASRGALMDDNLPPLCYISPAAW
jgi:hypothetical protein